jgi:urease accessory protein UreF
MYQTNLTEMFRERQLALLREAEDRRLARRLARRLRAARPQRSSRTESRRPGAGFRRTIASWERTSIPFFRA